MVLVGGIGTLSGAPIGAALLRLMTFYFDKWFGESSGFILGVVYVLLVLFLPYGVVGTWRLKSFQWRQGWQRILQPLGIEKNREPSAGDE